MVLGITTFVIAKWDRKAGWDGALGHDGSTEACDQPALDSGYSCGMVWGYLLEGAEPPHFLLQQISQNDNPLAPNMIALVEKDNFNEEPPCMMDQNRFANNRQ